MRCDVAYRPFNWSRWIVSRQKRREKNQSVTPASLGGEKAGCGSSAKENRDEGSVDQHRGDLPDPRNFPRFEPISSLSLCNRDTLAGVGQSSSTMNLPLSPPGIRDLPNLASSSWHAWLADTGSVLACEFKGKTSNAMKEHGQKTVEGQGKKKKKNSPKMDTTTKDFSNLRLTCKKIQTPACLTVREHTLTTELIQVPFHSNTWPCFYQLWRPKLG